MRTTLDLIDSENRYRLGVEITLKLAQADRHLEQLRTLLKADLLDRAALKTETERIASLVYLAEDDAELLKEGLD
jgi:hypothetical protein